MPDEADRAQLDIDVEASLMSARAAALAAKQALKVTGFCHNCEEPTQQLFCDADCRDDYQKRNRAERFIGVYDDQIDF